MKFLHMSDLHIGKNVNGFSMLKEQEHVFEQIFDYIQSEKPKLVIIAGDVYDRAVPSTEAVNLFDDFLTKLSNAGVTVLLISGNHDSPERLNFASRLLSNNNIHIGSVLFSELKPIKFTDDFGCVAFWLLPFIRPSSVRGVFGHEVGDYGDGLKVVLKSANIDYADRNVLVSHQFFVKENFESMVRSESETSFVGGLDAIDVELVKSFDYVALGHLHTAQPVGHYHHVRYAGAPVKYSFSECEETKSITCVELNSKNNVFVSELPLTPLHSMCEIKGKFDDIIERNFEVCKIKGELGAIMNKKINAKDYLRVILTDEYNIMNPMETLREVYSNVMNLCFENLQTTMKETHVSMTTDKIETLSPYDLFGEFYSDTHGIAINCEEAAMVRNFFDIGSVEP